MIFEIKKMLNIKGIYKTPYRDIETQCLCIAMIDVKKEQDDRCLILIDNKTKIVPPCQIVLSNGQDLQEYLTDIEFVS